jgi:hypothetical protein
VDSAESLVGGGRKDNLAIGRLTFLDPFGESRRVYVFTSEQSVKFCALPAVQKQVSHIFYTAYGRSFRKFDAAGFAIPGGKDVLEAFIRATFIYGVNRLNQRFLSSAAYGSGRDTKPRYRIRVVNTVATRQKHLRDDLRTTLKCGRHFAPAIHHRRQTTRSNFVVSFGDEAVFARLHVAERDVVIRLGEIHCQHILQRLALIA